MARQYLRTDTDTGNKTANSYGLGTVRRVVTIASPNLGTPIGSYLSGKFSTLPSSWQNWQGKTFWEGTGYTLIKMLAANKNYSDEVMSDVALGSSYLAGLGYPGIPFHSIYGKIKSDEGKIGQLFDDVVNQNIVSLSQIDWLPERLVETLTSSKLGLISGVLKALSDDIRFKELMGALYGDDDYDLVVSETSAKDKFPANAVTAFEGLSSHSHIMIARQDDVGDRVIALLRGGTENFMINTVSAAEYNAAFDAAADSFAESLRASAEGDLSEYLDESMTLEAEAPVDEFMGDDEGEEPVVQSMKISGKSSSVFSEDICVTLEDMDGSAKFFIVGSTNQQSFDVSMWADPEAKGIYSVSYFTVQDGKLKISPEQIVAFAPKFSSTEQINVFWSAGDKIYAHAGEEVPAGLVVQGEYNAYDISALDLGVATYEVSDTSIAEITRDGKIHALKEGTTTITATAYGQSASVTFVVKTSASEEDTTKDIIVSGGSETTDPGNPGGGCNAGFAALCVLSVLALAVKRS